jgi:hypothetical protein
MDINCWDLSCLPINNKVKGLKRIVIQIARQLSSVAADGAGQLSSAAIAATVSILFVGVVAAVLKSVRLV